MTKPHKHATLIKAWADGAKIQYWSEVAESWRTTSHPSWEDETTYRIKPEPKPDVIKYCLVQRDGVGISNPDAYYSQVDNLKLIFDGETGKLKKAEVL